MVQVDDLLAKMVATLGMHGLLFERGRRPFVGSSGSRKGVAGAAQDWLPRSWLHESSPMTVYRSDRLGMT